MKKSSTVKLVLATTVLSLTSSLALAQSPTWSAEQTEVWGVVVQSWVDDTAQNKKWPAEYVVDNVLSWNGAYPSPRNKDSLIKWSRFGDSQSKTLMYENTPVGIAIHGDTAVVMYTHVSVSQRGKDKPSRDMSSTTETLVRTDDGWKFISLTGFDTSPK
ncbi:MAG: nuclear transport factor 2 family protein [Acidimicrobiales bacterium]|nr:nuclear transport factor 2 family protein [Hyphomonadaceae bacterium]RZV42159.1 MAG: nuclear transport factor 2 family protein [Acidimicrobiales bacterium]